MDLTQLLVIKHKFQRLLITKLNIHFVITENGREIIMRIRMGGDFLNPPKNRQLMYHQVYEYS